jgi:hypothetical protein
MLGEHESAIDRFERALRLRPRDPTVFHMHAGVAYANLFAGRCETASSAARDALRDKGWLGGLRILVASKALAGHIEEARAAVDRLLQADPAVRISNLKDRISPFSRKILPHTQMVCVKPDCLSNRCAIRDWARQPAGPR